MRTAAWCPGRVFPKMKCCRTAPIRRFGSELSSAEATVLRSSMFTAPVSLPTYTKLLARAGFAEIGTEDWSSRVSPTYDRWSKYLPQDPDQRPNVSHPLPSAWSRSSACLPISCFRQFSGTDFPTPRAAPSARRFDEADFLNGRMSA